MTARERQALTSYLESDQLVRERSRPVAPAQLSRWAGLGLWALRIFTFVVSAMVLYTFVSQLGG